jgi:hypothetical protein
MVTTIDRWTLCRPWVPAVAIALVIGTSQQGSAADAAVQVADGQAIAGPSAWALQVTPYLWATGLSGRISPFQAAPTIEVDKSFSDVMEHLNLGGFVNVWGRYDRFVVSADVMYVDTTEAHAFGPLPSPGGPLPPGTTIKADVDTTEFMANMQVGYRVLDMPTFTVDALAGGRYWHIANDLTVSALGLSRSISEDFAWIDPLVGARALFRITDRLSVLAQADIGGFGVSSDLTWSALATLNYTVSDHLSVSAGYKIMDVDFDRGGYVFDARLQGPVVGATWRF